MSYTIGVKAIALKIFPVVDLEVAVDAVLWLRSSKIFCFHS